MYNIKNLNKLSKLAVAILGMATVMAISGCNSKGDNSSSEPTMTIAQKLEQVTPTSTPTTYAYFTDQATAKAILNVM